MPSYKMNRIEGALGSAKVMAGIAIAVFLAGMTLGTGADKFLREVLVEGPSQREVMQVEVDSLEARQQRDADYLYTQVELLGQLNISLWCFVLSTSQDPSAEEVARACRQFDVGARTTALIRSMLSGPEGRQSPSSSSDLFTRPRD